MCQVVGAHCFFAENTLARVPRNLSGSDDYLTDFWKTTIAAGKPLALWLSSTMEVDFVFVETVCACRNRNSASAQRCAQGLRDLSSSSLNAHFTLGG